MDAGVTVDRRVLSILSSGAYITVAPELDAERYTAGLRRRDLLLLGASATYILFYLGAWCVLWYRRRKSI